MRSGWDAHLWKLCFLRTLFFWREGKGERGRERSTRCLSYAPQRGTWPGARHVPGPGIQQATFHFAGGRSTNRARRLRAQLGRLLSCSASSSAPPRRRRGLVSEATAQPARPRPQPLPRTGSSLQSRAFLVSPGYRGSSLRPRGESRGFFSAARPRGEAPATHLVAALPFHRAPLLIPLAIPPPFVLPAVPAAPTRSLCLPASPRTSADPLPLSSPAAPAPSGEPTGSPHPPRALPWCPSASCGLAELGPCPGGEPRRLRAG